MFSKTKKAICLLGVTALVTTGCADIAENSTISKNGQVTTETKILAEKTAADQYFQEIAGTSFITLNTVLPGMKTVQKDGKTYYSLEKNENTTIAGMYSFKASDDEIIKEGIASGDLLYDYSETCVNVNGASVIKELAADKESASAYDAMMKQLTMNVSVTFPYQVTKTNGTLSEDGRTVTFSDALCKTAKIYAYTDKDFTLSGIKEGGISPKNKVSFTSDIRVKEGTRAVANGGTLSDGSHILTATKGDVQKTIYTIVDTKGPVFHSIKNKKYYKQNIYYATVSDKSTDVVSITLDKKKSPSSYYIPDVTKNGKHTVVAKDAAGNTSKCTFYLDKKKPTVKGAKNGKTYYKSVKIKCRDNMKLKSVKVNGKKRKTSFTLKKKGKYTIVAQDKAGNKTKVKFKIK